MRFLQLRLKELAGQEEHYKAELKGLRQQQRQLPADDLHKAATSAEAAAAPAETQQEPAASEAPALVPQTDPKPEPAAEEGILSSALPSPQQQQSDLAARQALLKPSASLGEQPSRLRRSQHRRKQERVHAPDLMPETLLRHPMFAALAGVRNPAKVLLLSPLGHPQKCWTDLSLCIFSIRLDKGFARQCHVCTACSDLPCLQVLEQTSIAESQQEHETFPACAYAALEFCERHLAALRNQLKQVRASLHLSLLVEAHSLWNLGLR